MRITTVFAIILIIVGIAAFGYQGFTYTTREKVIDIGSLDVSVTKKKTIPIPPIVGGIALLAGLVLIPLGRNKDN